MFHTSFYGKVKMQQLATQSISSSTTDTNFIFLLVINTSYFGSVRSCMPKIALEMVACCNSFFVFVHDTS